MAGLDGVRDGSGESDRSGVWVYPGDAGRSSFPTFNPVGPSPVVMAEEGPESERKIMLPAIIPLALQLLPLIGAAAPVVGKMLAGEKGEEVAKDVVGIAEAVTGVKGDEVINALKADPNLVLRFQQDVMQYQISEINAQRDIIVAEAKSESWLTRNWRPMTMMIFVTMLVGWWMGWIEQPERITEDMVLEFLQIVKFGLSGYVGGRTVEKVAPSVVQLFKKGRV